MKRNRLKTLLVSGAAIFALTLALGLSASGNAVAGLSPHINQMLICHIPPGNPLNFRTIWIDPEALDPHLAHRDYEGLCEL